MSRAARRVTGVLAGVLALCGPATRVAAQPPTAPALRPWTDSSPHQVRRVTVAPGVQLEVLDWGGATGAPALVFLAGLGNTGHVFDTFAPRFRDQFHVYAVTRRGFGYSSDPADGNDAATRARDIVTVLDALGVDRAVLAGHSIAGDELSQVGATYPARVRALVYLDAYSYGPERRAADQLMPPPPPGLLPQPTGADTASPAAVTRFWSRTVVGAPGPESEVRALLVFGPDGRPTGPRDRNGGKTGEGTEASPFARITAPALGLFATSPGGAADFLRATNYARLDSAGRAAADRFFAAVDARRAAGRAQFRAGLARGTIVELPGANHYVFLTQPDRVEREMRAFLARTP